MKRFAIASIFILLALCFVFTQEKETQNPKDIFLEAESYLLYEEFAEALPLYLKLSKADPINDNLNYKVGLCYLSVPYEKERAILYLEKAVKNINPLYKPNNFKETGAPLDAFFYLGNAYRINNQLDKALETYKDFKKQVNPEIYDETLVDEQIAAIERAKRYQKNPLKFEPKNLGDGINSKFAETNAVVSSDEKTLVYNVKLQFYDALYYSVKKDIDWSSPINIIPDLGVDGDVYATSLSSNGKELYIYRSDNFDGNLYVSHYINNRWTPIKRLNENINTKYWESHASVSADGKSLFFTSNRRGGYGGLDIYESKRTDINTDNWEKPENLGPQVNTSYNEETPFITDDGTTLYYSSYGHFNMGGYDIFYSNKLDNGKWSAPLSMGYPINTTDDDLFFVPVKNGNFAYITRYYPEYENFGKTDIYRVEIYSDQHPRKFILKGLLSLPADAENSNYNLTAYIINKSNRDTIQVIAIDPKKARFDSKLDAGNYQLIVQGEGFEKSLQDFSIDKNQSADEITLKADLRKIEEEQKPLAEVKKEKSELIFNKNIYIVSNGDYIQIPLALPAKSNVSVEISIDSILSKKQNFITKRDNSVYSYKPQPGKNILRFNAITPDNELKEGVIVIIYNPEKDTTNQTQEFAGNDIQLNYAKSILASMAGKKLSNRIKQLNTGNEKLNLNQYSALLKTYAGIDTFKPQEVDTLMAQYLREQRLAAQLFINALKELSSPQLANEIDNVCKNRNFNNVFEVVKALIASEAIQNNNLELISVSSHLADNGNVYYYLNGLKKVAPKSMKKTLEGVNLQKMSINSPESLLEYLYSQQASGGYTADDIYNAYFSLPIFTDPANMLSIMASISQEPLFGYLNSVHVNEKQVRDGADLGKLLKKMAKEYNVQEAKILALLIKANTTHYYNVYKEDLSYFSTGKVKDILSMFAIDDTRSDSSPELLNWLLKHSDEKDYKNDLILTFSQIASKNLLQAYKMKSENNKQVINTLNVSIIAIFSLLLVFIILMNLLKRGKEND